MISDQQLQSWPLFGGVSNDDIQTIRALLKVEDYPTGAWLFHQDDAGDRLFLIVAGRVEVLDESSPGKAARLAIRGVGDSIGEMTLIDIQNRSASVRALEPVRVLSLSHHDLHRLYQSHQQLFILIIMNIAREISRRLRSMDTLLSSALYHCADSSSPSDPDN